MSTKAIEDYVKAIYTIVEQGEDVSTNAIARELKIKAASVTGMLRKLAKLNLIRYEPYRQIELTDAGEKVALEIIRHHRLIELFLAEALGMPWDEVHDEAEKLEHVISENLEDRIAEALGHPEFDPHGDPIPARDGSIRVRDLVELASIPEESAVTVARVRNQSPEVLRHLADLGLVPGAAIKFIKQEPLSGPIQIQINKTEHVIAHDLAAQIMVEK